VTPGGTEIESDADYSGGQRARHAPGAHDLRRLAVSVHGVKHVAPDRPYAVAFVSLFSAILAAACGSSSVTNVIAPDDARCAASVTADPVTVVPDGGTVTVTIAAERECTWSARSDASWLLVRKASGQGNDTVAATVSRNEQPVSRSASLTVNDQRLTITQQPRPCDLSLQGLAGTIPFTGGTGTMRLTTIAGCAWTATSSAPWLLVQTSAGSGTADIRFDVLANDGPAREATITVAGQTTIISQAAVVTAPVCTYTIDSQAQAFPVSGGPGSVTVSTLPDCAWTATGGTSWVTLLATSGNGPGDARYEVSANTTTQARQTTLTIAGRVHTVTQPGLPCTYAISPPSASFPASGGTASLQVSTPGGCSWSASSNAGWIVVGTTNGNGTGQISYQVLANTFATQRTGTITVGGQTHTVTQAAPPPPCMYSLDPVSRAFEAAGGPGTLTVNTPGDHCSWTAVSNDAWITVASSSGSGTTTISYTVADHTGTSQRSGTITIGGQTHTVTQAGAPPPCSYSIEPVSATFADAGGQGTVSLTTGPTCAWTATSSAPWITVATPSGTGPAGVGYAVAANTATTQRSGTVTIGGQTHTVTQAGAPPPCTYAIDPTSAAYLAAGGQGTVSLTTGPTCAWTATSSAPWITVATPSGTGPAGVGYAVAANTATTQRSGTVTIGGQTHTVTQAGTPPPCTYAIDPTSAAYPAAGGQGTVSLTTGPTCAWTATSSAPWITVATPSGTGPAGVGYAVAANTATTQRSGTVTIGGQVHTVTQAGAPPPCTYTLDPTSATYAAAGGQGMVSVNTGPTCGWTAVSSQSWVTVGTPSSGTGTGAFTYTVAPNTSTAQRTATITVAGQTHTITQAGAIVCTYSLSPGTVNVAAGASQGSVVVTTQASCAWTATSTATWITITPGPASGTGSATVLYSVAANDTTAERIGSIQIGGQTHTITQAAMVCTYALDPTSRSFLSAGGPGSVAIETHSACAWTATSSASWIAVSLPSGTGSATVGYTVAANTATTERTGTITIGGQMHTVTQAGLACTYTLNPVSANVAAGASQGSVTVTTQAGCTWTATTTVTWVTLTPGPASGTGTTSIGYSVAANTGTTPRTGAVLVAGQAHDITQAAPATP
jgi:hypothetical protein